MKCQMNETAAITYQISDQEWLRISGMRWDPEVFPTYYCFHGRVSFRVGKREVLGTDHFDISVADLAVGFANVVGELRTGSIGTFKFQQGDDMLEISFQADKESVTISHNLSPDETWQCGRATLERAMVDFVIAFTEEASKKVPDLLKWREMEILRFFASAKRTVLTDEQGFT